MPTEARSVACWQEKQTCEECWERAFSRRRLSRDGVLINKEEQRITIIEVKRTVALDRREDYWERADARATDQYADLETDLTDCLEATTASEPCSWDQIHQH
jgi:hypothetical protein